MAGAVSSTLRSVSIGGLLGIMGIVAAEVDVGKGIGDLLDVAAPGGRLLGRVGIVEVIINVT